MHARPLFAFALSIALAMAAGAQDEIVRIPPERSRAPVRPPEPPPLSSELDGAFREGLDLISLGAPRADESAPAAASDDDCASCGIRAATRLGFTRVPTEERARALEAAWTPHVVGEAADEVLWTAALRSAGAAGLRLELAGVDLGAGELRLWTWHRGEPLVRGPYTGRGRGGAGTFWSPTLPGDVVHLEVRGEERPRLRIASLAHFERLPGGAATNGSGADDPDGDAHPCHVDVNCTTLTPGLEIARDASGQMNFQKPDGDWTVCSGTLLNDLDPTSQVPFFITAYHCVSADTVADTVEVVWHFEQTTCNGIVFDWSSLPRSCGATILAENPTTGGNDLCLLRLDEPAPPTAAFAGFTSAGTPEDTTLYAIHHPDGDVKKITHYVNSWLFLCPFAWSEANYDYFEASLGTSEGGSSGCGLFDEDGIFYGQNLGQCCEAWIGLECEESDCGNQRDWRAVFGESAVTWPHIQTWIETGGTIHVDQGNTSPPYEGTPSHPFPTVAQGLGILFPGARLLIHGGSYGESATFDVPSTTVDATGGAAVVGQ